MNDPENIDSNQGGQQSETEEILGGAPSFEEHMREFGEQPRRKSAEEKAKERGYFKNADGVWMKHNEGWGVDEFAEWFKLDEEYPDLADKTEALAEKYNVLYNDHEGLKEFVYKNADKLTEVSDEHLESIFAIAQVIPFRMRNTAEILVGYSSEELSKIQESLSKFHSATADRMPEGKLGKEIMGISEHFVQNFNPKLIEGDFLDKLSEYSAKALLDNKYSLIIGIERGIQGIGKNECSGKFFGEYMEYVDELVDDERRIMKYETKFDIFTNYYVLNHGVNEETVTGFKNVIFPLLEQGDAEVGAIMRGGNVYGIENGTYGIADYTEECLLSRYNPEDIDKLVRIYHEIPTSDLKKFEQNRKDAFRLQGTIIGGRDFIHDEHVGTHEVLCAIKDYYDHREDENAESYKQRLEELETKYHFGVLPNAFNLEAYEKPIKYMAEQSKADEGSPDERAIDILNRLVENTRPNLLEAPTTKFPELNELMSNISPLINEQTGEVRVGIKEVGAAITKMNEILAQKSNEQGIMPSTISAIAFLDKMSAYALRGVSSKEIQELAFDPSFKEIVRFSQLTSSAGYNERDFENKYRQVVSKVSEAYGEDGVDSSVAAEGYRILSQNILNNMQALAKGYASKETTARFRDAIWSGNLSDELIGLFQRV